VCRQEIFTIISAAACITNAALSVMTMDVLNHHTDMFRMWFFVLFQWGCFFVQASRETIMIITILANIGVAGVQVVAMALVPDEPAEVAVQTGRMYVCCVLKTYYKHVIILRTLC
jgi:Na+/melibiose symporter-like transporter